MAALDIMEKPGARQEAEARQYCMKVAEDVLGMEGVRCELKATSPGLGYMSYSFAAKLTGNYKQYNLFVKVAPGPLLTCTCTPCTTCISHHLHQRESTNYTWLHPNLRLCLSEAGMSLDLLSILVTCHHLPFSLDTKDPIIMEDLMVQGFTPPTSTNLTLQQSRLVVQALATYHALGAAFLDRSGGSIGGGEGSIGDKLHKLFELPVDWFESLGEPVVILSVNGIETFIDYLERSGKDAATIEASKGFRSYLRTGRQLIQEWKQAEFLTFVLGDCRANNFMFHNRADGTTDRVKMFDLQLGVR